MTPQKTKQGFKLVKSLFGKNEATPNDWDVQKIEDCCDILDSKRVPLNSDERKKMQGIIPYYGANGVLDFIDKHVFDEDLVLLAEDGGYFNEYSSRPIAQFVTGKSWVNNHAHVLKNKINYNLKFIYYSLVHKNITPWINGSTRTKLNQSELREIKIHIPIQKKEQQKIASILSNVDALISSYDDIIQRTKVLKKGLMQQLLTKGIGHTKFKNSNQGRIPQDWELVKLKDICVKSDGIQTGPFGSLLHKSDYKDKGTPLINVEHLGDNFLIYENMALISDKDKQRLSKFTLMEDDIVFSRVGSIDRRALMKKNQEGWLFSGNCLRVRPDKQKVDSLFLSWFFGTKAYRKQVLSGAVEGTRPSLNTTILSRTEIFLPPLREQQKIALQISEIAQKLEFMEQMNDKMKSLKKGLMQKLLTGQIRVKV